ncbi:MAG: hypothetical protein EBR82_63510 [Caulobacteraceae bacterium]|nr:hypothetical protein [Caulobacteraceae bacterium]
MPTIELTDEQRDAVASALHMAVIHLSFHRTSEIAREREVLSQVLVLLGEEPDAFGLASLLNAIAEQENA